MATTVKSNLLDIDIELKETEDGLTILPHATIDKILMDYPRIKVNLTAKQLNPNMCVVEAQAEDTETGKKTPVKIGESNPLNLENEIARKFPATLAYQRATDRAVILLLELPLDTKVYSSVEIDNVKYKKEEPAEPKETKEIDKAISTAASLEPVKAPDLNITEEHPFASEKKEKVSENTNLNNSTGIFSDDEVLLIGGACCGKRYGEVKDTANWTAFLNHAKKMTANYPDEARNKQLKAVKDFLEKENK